MEKEVLTGLKSLTGVTSAASCGKKNTFILPPIVDANNGLESERCFIRADVLALNHSPFIIILAMARG